MDAGLAVGGEHDCAGAVAEEHAGAAIVPVEDAREDFRADHQRAFRLAGADEVVGGREAVDEAAAHRLHVEGRLALDAELGLQKARGARKDIVRRRGRNDDQVELIRPRIGGLQRLPARLEREIARALRCLGDAPLADTRALADPFVARLQPARGEVRIGHHVGRQKAAGAGNARVDHGATAATVGGASSAMRLAMRLGTSFLTSSSARTSAWPKARLSAEPWLFMTMPRSPSRLAPLYLAGSMRWRSALSTGLASNALNIFQGVRLNSLRNNPTIMCTTPSDAFRSALPTKPSHTTTSVVPL